MAFLFLQVLDILRRTADNIKDPLFRFFEREVRNTCMLIVWGTALVDSVFGAQVNSGAHLLRDVRHDLSDVVEICEGRKKQTNYLRSLVSDLAKGMPLLFHLFP